MSIPSTLVAQSTCSAGNNYLGANACLANFYYAANDYFYQFTAPETGYISILVTQIQGAGNLMPSITAFDGCPGSGNCLNNTIGSFSAVQTGHLSLLLPVTQGQSYFVVLDGYSNGASIVNCYNFNIQFQFIPIVVQPGCANVDFEAGNLSGWMATTGQAVQSSVGSPTPNYNMGALGVVPGRHTLMTSGTDPYGAFPRRYPQGGAYSLRLGNDQSSAEAEQINQTFIVGPENSSFTYHYAVVFQAPDHESHQQPFFKALLKDQSGNIIQCSEFIVSAAASLPGFQTSTINNSVVFKPWSTVNVDLSDYIGQTVTAEFTTGDCTHGGHFGYAYIDVACSPSQFITSYPSVCPGDSLHLQGPTGYAQYAWWPLGLTTQNIDLVPLQSQTLQLQLTSQNGCTRSFQVPVVVNPLPTPAFQASVNACTGQVSLINQSSIASGSIASFQWMAAGLGNSSQVAPLFLNVLPGQYAIQLTATSDLGCAAAISESIVVDACAFDIQIPHLQLCAGQCSTLTAQVSQAPAGTTYLWSTGEQTNVPFIELCPNASGTVSVVATAPDGSQASAQASITIVEVPQVAAIVEPASCFGGSNGSIQLLNIPADFTFTWQDGSQANPKNHLSAGSISLQTAYQGCAGQQSFVIGQPNALQFSYTELSPSCGSDNGCLEITSVSGGNPPYQWTLNGNALAAPAEICQLSSGLHTLQLSDANGCEQATVISLSAQESPELALVSLQNPTCNALNNGVVQVQVLGGMAPFEVLWFDGYTGLSHNQLPEGTHWVQVTDALQCSHQLVFTLQAPPPITFETTIMPSTCGISNGSISIQNAQGGSGALQFMLNQQWSATGFWDGLQEGNYFVQVVDSLQCVLAENIQLPSLPYLQSLATQVLDDYCGFGNGSISFIEPNDYTGNVFWQNGTHWETVAQWPWTIMGLASGAYTYHFKDETDCPLSLTISLLSISGPSHLSISSTPASCGQANGCLTLSDVQGGQAPYLWSLNGQLLAHGTHCQLPQGLYEVTVQDAQGCTLSNYIEISTIDDFGAVHQIVQDISCHGAQEGQVMVTPLGGNAPYSILWSDGNQNFQRGQLLAGNYVYTVSDATGCLWQGSIQLTEPPPITIQYTTSAATCGQNNGMANFSGSSGGTGALQFFWNELAVNGNAVSGLTAGTHILTAQDQNLCTVQQTITIPSTPYLQTAHALALPSNCSLPNGQIQIIHAGNFEGQVWWQNGVNWQLIDAWPVVLNDLSAGIYALTLRDENHCYTQVNLEVQDIPGPWGITYDVEPASCGLPNGTIHNLVVQGGQAPYLFSLNASSFSSTNQWTGLAAGTYQIQVLSANQCLYTHMVNLPSIAPLSITIQNPEAVSCFGYADGKASMHIEGGTSPYTILWENGETQANAQQLSAGWQQVQVTDASGCTHMDSVFIQSPLALSFSLTAAATTCGLSNGKILIQQAAGGNSPYQWTLNGNHITPAGMQFTELADTVYMVSLTDTKGCTLTQDIEVLSIPYIQSFSLSKVDAHCNLANGIIALDNVQGFPGPFAFQLNTGIWSTGIQAQFDNLSEGFYTVTVRDSNFCMLTDTLTLHQFSSPDSLSLSLTPATCSLQNAAIELLEVHGGTAPYIISINNASPQANTLFQSLAPGYYTLTIQDNWLCTLSQEVYLPDIPRLQIDASVLEHVYCHGDSTGKAMASMVHGVEPLVWHWGNGATETLTSNLWAGIHFVYATDAMGCTDSAWVQVEQSPEIHLTIQGATQICEGQQVLLTAVYSGGNSHLSLLWVHNQSPLPQQMATPETGTTYVVTGTDAYGCMASDSHFVQVNPLPELQVISDKKNGCAPLCANFFPVGNVQAIAQFHWSFSNGFVSHQAQPKNCFPTPGELSVHLAVTDTLGCSNQFYFEDILTIYPNPIAQFDAEDRKLEWIAPHLKTINQSTQGVECFWDFGDGHTSQDWQPTHTYSDTGRYEVCLKVITEFACEDEYCLWVEVLPYFTLYAPNAFTPNGDGHNDAFGFDGMFVKDLEFFIFNRWGENLFVGRGMDSTWDGYFKGQLAPSDMYVWQAKAQTFKGDWVQLQGRVNLLR